MYECPRSIRVYRPETPTSIKFSVEEKTVEGRKVKAYRKFEIFGTDPANQRFSEEILLISSDGLFLSTTLTKGRLTKQIVELRLTNSWRLNAKFAPVVVPKNLMPPSETKQTLTL